MIPRESDAVMIYLKSNFSQYDVDNSRGLSHYVNMYPDVMIMIRLVRSIHLHQDNKSCKLLSSRRHSTRCQITSLGLQTIFFSQCPLSNERLEREREEREKKYKTIIQNLKEHWLRSRRCHRCQVQSVRQSVSRGFSVQL